MRRLVIGFAFVVVAAVAAGCVLHSRGTAAAATEAGASASELAFQNSVTGVPPGWTGPVFELSHDYPQADPGTCPPTTCTWLANQQVDFNVGLTDPPPMWNEVWADYLQQILDYVKEGQDPQLRNEIGWQVGVGTETRWFHVPWMAYDPTRGREFIHGLTNERTASIEDFIGPEVDVVEGRHSLPLTATTSTAAGFETWAFGVYNPWGAYAIGQSWPPDGEPETEQYGAQVAPAGLPFPQGALVAKLLFTTATPEDVYYLAGSPAWQADRHVEEGDEFYCRREPQLVHLVQLDVAVTDSRSPTGWVFGTFAYDGTLNGATPWDRLAPVGVQWGSDPWTFPAVPQAESLPPRESVLNLGIGIPQHFGCNGRLAGPVDNPMSSCLSCHGAAYAPPAGQAALPNTTPPIFGFEGLCTNYSLDNAEYFADTAFPMSYTGGNYPNLMSMDTSLQMQVAFEQYGQFNQYGAPVACTDPA
jgi:hypothetical protein